MKFTTTILTITSLLFYSIIWGQTNIETKTIITKEVRHIDSIKNFNQNILHGIKSANQNHASVKELIGLYTKGKLFKIVSKENFADGIEQVEYYYHNSKLIYVYEQSKVFIHDEKIPKHNSTETNFEGRYYFSNNKLIDQVTTGHNRFENEELDPENVLVTESENSQNLLRTHKKSHNK